MTSVWAVFVEIQETRSPPVSLDSLHATKHTAQARWDKIKQEYSVNKKSLEDSLFGFLEEIEVTQ